MQTDCFDKYIFLCYQNNSTVCNLWHENKNNLWKLVLKSTPHKTKNSHKINKFDLIVFIYASAYSPVTPNWIKAIKKYYFNTWHVLNN